MVQGGFTFASSIAVAMVWLAALCEASNNRTDAVSNPFNSSTGVGPPYREQRTVPRYEFIATVEVVEPVSDMRLSGRVSEISRKGCFVDILNTLPAGTKINLRITRDRGAFFTPATIIYVQDGMGMGIAFKDPAADQMQILDAWLAELGS